jgi:hypothetical protein
VAKGTSIEQHSELRAWIRSGQSPMHIGESVSVNAGEMPVGGPGVMSSRRSTQQAAESSAVLELQRRTIEKEREQAEKRAAERDPALFAYEEYYFFDQKSFHDRSHRVFSRAIALPPGEYDFYVGILDRAAKKTDRPILLERRVMVPDFWNDDLRLSTLILATDMQLLAAPLVSKQQGEQPYTFGRAALAPTLTQIFSPVDVLTIVYQICNYAAPDAALTANYQFYRVDAERRLFKRHAAADPGRRRLAAARAVGNAGVRYAGGAARPISERYLRTRSDRQRFVCSAERRKRAARVQGIGEVSNEQRETRSEWRETSSEIA